MVVAVAVAVGLSVVPATAAVADPPRLILDSAKLSSLRQRAQAGDPEWAALRAKCENYLNGVVRWPDGVESSGNDIGEGYQGQTYLPAVANLGLCYRIAQTVDPSRAPLYGAKGVDVLTHMSAPDGDPNSPNVLKDDVFGIRFYGVGLSLGYDWLYDAMSASDKVRVYTAIDRWIDAYESSGFGRDNPQGNYFAGYYAAKALAGPATEGDDPRASAHWSDFLNRVHGQMVQPYYAANLAGGGWPEGQNYGPLAEFNMILPVVAAKTAKNVDLVNAAAPYQYPSGMATWYEYNTWPSLKRVDDRGTMRASPEPAPAPVRVITQIAGMLPYWNDPSAASFHRFARDVRAANPSASTDLWSDFLFWDPAAPEADYNNGPLASDAHGMEMASVRSSWDTSAVWGSLNAGPYTGNPDAAEELFDSGSLAVAHGNQPFLVNATGQLFRGANKPDDFIYADNFDSSGTRGLYNIFYTDSPTPTGQDQRHTRANGARTNLSVLDPAQHYVFMRASHLEDMYPRSGTSTISSWDRDVIYLRPNIFVVYDRTTTTDANVGQWVRFHFAGAPVRAADPSPGVSRYDISGVGSVSTLLPVGHQETVTPTVFAGSDVSRLDVKPATASAQNRWLTVVDAGDGNVLAGAVTGTLLRSPNGNYAVLNGIDETVAAPIRYRVGAENTRHIVTGLPANTTFAVTTTSDANGVVVDIEPGSGPKTSAAGVLDFTTPSSTTPPPSNCQTSAGGGAFVPASMPAQSGGFGATWDVTPSTATVDGAIGLAKGAASTWSDLAGIVRFGASGTVDARDGATTRRRRCRTPRAWLTRSECR